MPAQSFPLGTKGVNAKLSADGKKLTIEIDMTKNYGLSGSGKNEIIASTGGNQPIPNTAARIGLNLYQPPS